MNVIDKLKSCRTCAEAQPIMETLKVRPSQRKLIETAIQLSHSKDPRQVAYGEDFMLTAIRELDPLEGQTTHMGKGDKPDFIKKEKEADEITGSLDSHQSSKIDQPYPKEGTDAPNSDIESMQTAQGQNQMGGIKENYPPMMGGGMGMPGMAPDLQRQMAPQMPQMPQMNTPQMMRQMQYTVQESMKRYFNPMVAEVRKLREAYIALDKKMQETQSQSGTMKLDLDSVKQNSIVRDHVRETISGTEITLPEVTHARYNLEVKRDQIAQMDKDLAKGIYQ